MELIVRVKGVLRRTVGGDWRFNVSRYQQSFSGLLDCYYNCYISRGLVFMQRSSSFIFIQVLRTSLHPQNYQIKYPTTAGCYSFRMSITSTARKNKRVYCTIVISVTLAWLSLVNIQIISWNRDQREFTSRPRRASSRPICELIVLSRLTALGAPKMGGAWRPIVSWFLRYQDRKKVM